MQDATIVFRGTSSAECEEFIRQVRKRAFRDGKQQDRTWMAGFASTCFAGDALWWFERQPSNVQDDWTLLCRALIAQYCQGSSSLTSTTPMVMENPTTLSNTLMPPRTVAFTPSSASYTTLSSQTVGRIRVISETTPRDDAFLSRMWGKGPFFGCLTTTLDRSNALQVQFNPAGGLQEIALKNSPTKHQLLGAMWNSTSAPGTGSTNWAYFVGVNRNPETGAMKGSRPSTSGRLTTAMWSRNPDGEVTAYWKDEADVLQTLQVVIGEGGRYERAIELVADFAAFEKSFGTLSQWGRARLVFEAL